MEVLISILAISVILSPFVFVVFVVVMFIGGTRKNAKAFRAMGYTDFSKAWVSPSNGKLYRYNIRTGLVVRAPDDAPRMAL